MYQILILAFPMKLKTTEDLPTDASFECDWGDGSALLVGEVNDFVESNFFSWYIPIEHSYSSAGFYNVSCRLKVFSILTINIQSIIS